MSRSSISRLFLAGVSALAVGLVLGDVSMKAAVASGAYEVVGIDVVGLAVTPPGFLAVALAATAAGAILAGALAGVVAWAAALANARAASSRPWFIGLLLLGIPTFGAAALLAYAVAGPEPRPAKP
jgi:hypothetical protein